MARNKTARSITGCLIAALAIASCNTAPTVDDAKKYSDVGKFIRAKIVHELPTHFLNGVRSCQESDALDRHGDCHASFNISPGVFGPKREADYFVRPQRALKLYCETNGGTFSQASGYPPQVASQMLDPVLVIAHRLGAFGEMTCTRHEATIWRVVISFSSGSYRLQAMNSNRRNDSFDISLPIYYSMPGQ